MRHLHDTRDAAQWLHGRIAGQLHCDSRKVGRGDGFIAWPGATTDGRHHVAAALAQGAAACLVESEGIQAFDLRPSEALACLRGLKAATGPIAAAYFEDPSARLDVLAVTGTNGKTSTTWWLAQAWQAARGDGCGLIGTLGIGHPPHVESTGLTTPDPVLLQARLRRFADQGLRACAIEASSIGITERRLDGTRVRVAVFTNFTQDHLDYHGTLQAYWEAKAELFRWPGLEAAVLNLDDARGAQLAHELAASSLDLWTYACDREARLRATDIDPGDEGLCFTVCEADERVPLRTHLIGQYNVANLLAVIGTLRACGVPLARAVAACGSLLPVPGRMERLQAPGQPLVAVDYAHTPDALAQALTALRPLAGRRGGRLWCVFGCGGDRDAGKRPLMAAVAQQRADRVLVTSDNPRSEKPENIISQILRGLSHSDRVEVQADRGQAIADAIARAAPEDVVLLAGKGHEDYQEIAGLRQPFDDRVHARQALARRMERVA